MNNNQSASVATSLGREIKPLYPAFFGENEDNWLSAMLGKEGVSLAASSNLVSSGGERLHPFDMVAIPRLQLLNIHHAICIQTKRDCTAGLGFGKPETPGSSLNKTDPKPALGPSATGNPAAGTGAKGGGDNVPLMGDIKYKSSKVDEVLDPLCDRSWQEIIVTLAEDYHQSANANLEVVRQGSGAPNDPIVGLFRVAPHQCRYFVENDGNYHFLVRGEDGILGDRSWATFGDTQAFGRRGNIIQISKAGTYSEIIHFKQPNSVYKWYGFPQWLAATIIMEMDAAANQQTSDFFYNRGVPDFFLFILGAMLDKKDWKKIEDAMKSTVGQKNQHKSLAVNLASKDIEIVLEKLMGDSGALKEYSSLGEANALKIVSAHRTPPLLAGIQVPGKMGAVNDLPNALVAFQTLVIGPSQANFQTTFTQTLANPDFNGGLDLTGEDFSLRTIVDAFNLKALDTMSRMQQSPNEAAAAGRDLNAGVKS